MKKVLSFLIPLLLAAAVVVSVFWYLFVFDRSFTRDMLLSQARNNDLSGNAKASSFFYNLAYNFSGGDQNVAIELANQYKQAGNYTKAEVTLSNAIRGGATPELYTALCRTYVEQDKLMDAVALLDNLANPEIAAVLNAQRPIAPQPDVPSGFYTQYFNVALTSTEGSSIFYTTDGEYPSISKGLYEQPIPLTTGETQILAIAVNQSGLVSDVTALTYTIGGVIEPAIFMDPAMEQAARQAAQIDDDKILYTNDLWGITEFTVPDGAQSLEDLHLFAYLKTLNILGRQFENLSELTSVTSLQTLVIRNSRVPAESLSALTQLPELTDLTLDNCYLSSVAELAGAAKLRRISLPNNTIRNLEVFTNMTQLEELDLQNNAVVSLEAIGGLQNLGKLNVSYNKLTTLQPLEGCLRLYSLDASHNTLSQVDGITGLPLLDALMLDYNQLTDITPLGGCLSLTKLSISNNQLTDISRLEALTNLDNLDFSYNSVSQLPAWSEEAKLRTITGSYNELTSIDGLAKLPNISYVYMDYNKLTNIDALAGCFHLVQVNVYGNDISDVSALTDHDIIVNYDPTK